MKKIKIIKAAGTQEWFSKEKLKRSLKKSGAGEEIIEAVVQEITEHLSAGMSTRQIYRQAFELLRQYAPPQAARYKLKQAIHELGPSGFPFELLVAALLRQEGYFTKVGIVAQGHCVPHEIDVEAQKDEIHFMVECKFHNNQGMHSDVKVPLYIRSRFLDVERKWKELSGHASKFHQAWIFTNTRFTKDALAYGTCMGMHLTSWDFPPGKGLRDRINASGLHPLTCLTTLTTQEKKHLLAKRIVLCKEICDQPELLHLAGIVQNIRIEHIVSEGRQLCQQLP